MIHTTEMPIQLGSDKEQAHLLEEGARFHGRVSDLLGLIEQAHHTPNPYRFQKLSPKHGLLVSYGSQAHLLAPGYADITWSPNRFHITGTAFAMGPLKAPFSAFATDGYLRHDDLTVTKEDFRRVLEPSPYRGMLVLPPPLAKAASEVAQALYKHPNPLQRT